MKTLYANSYVRLGVLFSILVLLSCNIQRKMLYYPDSSLPSQSDLRQLHIAFWPSNGPDYRGFIGTLPIKHIQGSILVFHGNAGTAADRSYYVHALEPLGYRVILVEYPGYGRRPGAFGEKEFVDDAAETMRLIEKEFGRPVFLLGESLGAAVAAAALKDSAVPLSGIILITPWDTLITLAKEKVPWLPVRLLLRDRYDTRENLKNFQGKTAVVAAARDDVIPLYHAESLFASLRGDKRMWILNNAGHNDWPDVVDQEWWNRVMAFMRYSPRD